MGSVAESLCTLKTITQSSGKSDQIALNNMVFLVQRVYSLPLAFEDFHSFGKYGVSSPKLSWFYNMLEDEWENIEEQDGDRIKTLKEFGKKFSALSFLELSLAALFLYDKKLLTSDEISKAIEVIGKIKA